MSDLALEQMNWEIAQANLQDAVNYCKKCEQHLDEALKEIAELRRRLKKVDGLWRIK